MRTGAALKRWRRDSELLEMFDRSDEPLQLLTLYQQDQASGQWERRFTVLMNGAIATAPSARQALELAAEMRQENPAARKGNARHEQALPSLS